MTDAGGCAGKEARKGVKCHLVRRGGVGHGRPSTSRLAPPLFRRARLALLVASSRCSSPPRAALHLLALLFTSSGLVRGERPLGVLLWDKLRSLMEPVAPSSALLFNSVFDSVFNSLIRSLILPRGSALRLHGAAALSKLLLSAWFPFRCRRQRAG